MSNGDVILEFLEHNRDEEFCDACISARAKVKPARQVNQICNRLSKRGTLTRADGSCSACRGKKITNALAPARSAGAAHAKRRPASRAAQPARSARPEALGVEQMRTAIVHICQELCRQAKIEVAPNDGPAGIIAVLKDEQLIPRHQANMMLTICNLRNVYVWEQVPMGPNEMAVASAAWEIVRTWWDRR